MATGINPRLRSHQAMVKECEHKQKPKIISWRSPPFTSKIHLKKMNVKYAKVKSISKSSKDV